jgi:GH15 family glucan-1,4-alpha-glucosidase
MCQFEETGAIVAAMTTSIPEAPNTERNWDYRYCWLRDAFFVVRALNSLSEVGTMEDYLRWLNDVVRGARGGHVQPLFGIGLEQRLTEDLVPSLSGYRGMAPVRTGNQAFEHVQHDVYGNIVLGAAQAFFDHRLFRRADARDFAELEGMGEQAWRLHDQPDAGMWELRTRARVHTSSSLMCWAACDRLAKIAVVFGQDDRHALWRSRADQIRATILARAWSEKRQAFAESFGGNELDASVLLMAEVGFIEPRDPRFVKTIEALEATLCDGPFMRRYEAPTISASRRRRSTSVEFWRIDALARVVAADEAREIFRRWRAATTSACLRRSARRQRRAGGNFPQTYSMVGIINGAVRLSQPWDSRV